MSKSKFVINKLAKIFEQGIISYKDLSSEILNILRSKRDEIVFKMKITSKEETEILNKRVDNLEAKIKKLDGHVACDHDVYRAKDCPIAFDHFPQRLKVNSFHNFGILDGDLTNSNLLPIYRDKASNVEAIASADGNVMGTMWHPERSFHTKCDVLQAWLAGCIE